MVQKLEEHPSMRFIYAEMAFFTMWWNEISPETKEKAKRFVYTSVSYISTLYKVIAFL